ncbi:hypothetical protein FRACYDRAFT_249651 [Fragilariopsis cylindrus CCMP1102]|uniref:Uncharacterized protein n=1 Tax=Fragilariopsis cylindrus CCMP1102 TaxID=635003 RepID=A0A1E7ESD2_9STRA|nr:hypothetical protein FRACYDRAFT_249651 [Fragilariopsis cylindrus CCMP1102]|eukprot:OEU08747.1 hypothetical protein FRACYDRAFT_249651 [Fragilariopsis cylindrus CCMP1102]
MDRDGEPFWEGNLPKEFMNNLRGCPRHLPRVDFVAFGPGDAYFEQFSKGKNHWNSTSDDFDDAMNNHSDGVVHFVAFAPDGGYYILFEDRSSEYFNVPQALYCKHNGWQKSLPCVDHVRDWRCNGQSSSYDDTINKIHEQGDNIECIVFGHDSTWLISYS